MRVVAATVIELPEVPGLARSVIGGVIGGVIGRMLPSVPGLSRPAGHDTAVETRDDGLPDVALMVSGARIDPAHVAAYADVCGFRQGSMLPVTYLHLLGFPLSVQIMTRDDFPFALLGMVHLRNHITAHRPVRNDEVLEVTAQVVNLRPHAAGQQMDNVVTVRTGGQTVWESVSTYLKRGQRSDVEEPGSGAAAVDVAALPLTAVWQVPADIGRRYAAVSGDRNPIHLSALSARPFGFPKAIAHGMWTAAHGLAALEGRLPGAVEVDVVFKAPLHLPATVEYATDERDPGGWMMGVRSRSGTPHMAGVATEAS